MDGRQVITAVLFTVILLTIGTTEAQVINLTGDWGGRRTALEERGIDIESSLTQFYQGVASGGLEQIVGGRDPRGSRGGLAVWPELHSGCSWACAR
jgi:carbohydrate-selective porin OprB